MKIFLRHLVELLVAAYVRRFGVDQEDRCSILMHLDWDVARRLGLNLDPEVAGDYLRYLKERRDKNATTQTTTN